MACLGSTKDLVMNGSCSLKIAMVAADNDQELPQNWIEEVVSSHLHKRGCSMVAALSSLRMYLEKKALDCYKGCRRSLKVNYCCCKTLTQGKN